MHVLGQGVNGKSTPSSQFCCELKTALKNKFYYRKFFKEK